MRIKTALGSVFLLSLAVAIFCFVQYMEKHRMTINHLAAGQALLQTGKYQAAIDEFRQCNPDNCQAMLGIAECSYFLGDDAGCITQIMAIARSGNKDCWGRALLLRGLVRKRAGDMKAAKECFHAAVVAGEVLAQNELDAMGG